jgi:hypothetical protein
VIKWRILREVGKKRTACRILIGKPKEEKHMEDVCIGSRIILKWREGRGLDSSGSG